MSVEVSLDSYGATACSAVQQKNQANGYKVRLKGKLKGEKKGQAKDEREAQHSTTYVKLHFVCALVGLRLWRSTSTHSITQDMAALLMQGVERVKLLLSSI